jgi:hypothetical protein
MTTRKEIEDIRSDSSVNGKISSGRYALPVLIRGIWFLVLLARKTITNITNGAIEIGRLFATIHWMDLFQFFFD